MIVSARKLVCGFGGQALHQPVDFEMCSGEAWVSLGANGAGKSTLLRTLLGLQASVSGEIFIENAPLTVLSTAQKAAIFAYVPQRALIPEGLTVEALLRLGAYRDSALLANIPKVLEQVNASDWRARLVSELSGGEQQRVLIARALVQGAKVLILDEPTAHLDVAQSQEISSLLGQICAAGFGVICSSHDPNDVLRLGAKTIAFLNKNKLEIISKSALNETTLQQIYGCNFTTVNVSGKRRFVASGI